MTETIATHPFHTDGHGYCTSCGLPKGNRRHKMQPLRAADAPEATYSPHAGPTPNTGTLKAYLLDVVRLRVDGATDDELEQITGRTHQSVSAARRGLVKDGHLVARRTFDGGEVTRTTRSGHPATVWVPAATFIEQQVIA